MASWAMAKEQDDKEKRDEHREGPEHLRPKRCGASVARHPARLVHREHRGHEQE
jgi:hypothetical protein